MERIYGAELGKYASQKVKVAGWVHNLRKLGKVNFLTVRDVSGIFQVFLTTIKFGLALLSRAIKLPNSNVKKLINHFTALKKRGLKNQNMMPSPMNI